MDDLPSDVIFVLVEERGGKEYVGTPGNIIFRVDVFLFNQRQLTAVIIANEPRAAYIPRELVAMLKNDRRESSIRSSVWKTLDTTRSSSRNAVLTRRTPEWDMYRTHHPTVAARFHLRRRLRGPCYSSIHAAIHGVRRQMDNAIFQTAEVEKLVFA